MLGYYFNLALRSLRQNVVLTALMVVAVGVGIGASMTTLSIFRAMSGDPIPEKSRQLFVPQIDNFGPAAAARLGNALPADRLPPYITYTDAVALMRAHVAERQAAMYYTSAAVAAPNSAALPSYALLRATYTDFFTMFDVPFEYGAPWSAADDAARAPLVVLSRKLNDKLFGATNSVGRTVTLDDKAYRVAGVIQDWNPLPRFYDLGAGGGTVFAFFTADQIFLPFTTAVARNLPQGEGGSQCPKIPAAGMDGWLHSECDWIQMWVELPDAAAARAYRKFLTNYAAEQRQLGRFNWTPRIALRNVRQWLLYHHVVSNDIRAAIKSQQAAPQAPDGSSAEPAPAPEAAPSEPPAAAPSKPDGPSPNASTSSSHTTGSARATSGPLSRSVSRSVQTAQPAQAMPSASKVMPEQSKSSS